MNTEMKDLNYADMEVEHQELLNVIRDSHGEQGVRKEPRDLVSMVIEMEEGLELLICSCFQPFYCLFHEI